MIEQIYPDQLRLTAKELRNIMVVLGLVYLNVSKS